MMPLSPRRRAIIVLLFAAVGLTAFGLLSAGQERTMVNRNSQIHAPEFPSGMQWLNTDRPLTLESLRGKVVLLDFWTYCCINCMHVLPDLKRLEHKYPNELVVIGVHSAKFEGEKETDNIRQAILRYEIEHPVINDHKMQVWRSFGVRAWPTLVLIDPKGYVVGAVSGEGNYDTLNRAIANLIKDAEKEGTLDRQPMRFNLEKETLPETDLLFPGKVLADSGSSRLFIADSGHNRVLITNTDNGEVIEIIGQAQEGWKDGSFEEARFNHPQGMALVDNTLYVADTENHLLRAVDLEKRTVHTIAGTGEQARFRASGGNALTASLNSPWDLVHHEGILYIAMAGPHQLWYYNPGKKEVGVFAGSGAESITDGPRLRATLAQPSGVTTDGHKIYFADSEVSAVRSVELQGRQRVETLVGTGLFDFGDRVGSYRNSLFQHPLGVAWSEQGLFVADTYNNRVKRIDLEKKKVDYFAGNGEGGYKNGPGDEAQFDEPGGISIGGNLLFVADTNNHQIRTVDIESRQVSTFPLDLKRQGSRKKAGGELIVDRHPAIGIASGEINLTVYLRLPNGYKMNMDGPNRIEFLLDSSLSPREMNLAPSNGKTLVGKGSFNMNMDSRLVVRGQVYFCPEGGTVCSVKDFRFARSLKTMDGGGTALLLEFPLEIEDAIETSLPEL